MVKQKGLHQTLGYWTGKKNLRMSTLTRARNGHYEKNGNMTSEKQEKFLICQIWFPSTIRVLVTLCTCLNYCWLHMAKTFFRFESNRLLNITAPSAYPFMIIIIVLLWILRIKHFFIFLSYLSLFVNLCLQYTQHDINCLSQLSIPRVFEAVY